MSKEFYLPIRLDLFEGAGAAAGGGDSAGAGAAASAVTGGNQGETQGAVPGNTRRGKSGETNVLYGKQEPAAAVSGVTEAPAQSQAAAEDANPDVIVTSNTLNDRRRAFQELINGEYKDVYTEETQRMINRRFKETGALQEQVDRMQPLTDMLLQRYGIRDGDISKLITAVENDSAYWSEAAEEAGMSVEQYKQFQKLQRENNKLLREQKIMQGRQYAQAQTEQWYREADALRAKFPDFDFAAELRNEDFVKMLKTGTPVEHAYKVIHFDELMGNVMQVTAANTQMAVVANVRARGARPAENGTAAQSAFTVKDDVHKLSKADRAEIARRAARGEKIRF